MVKAVVGPRPTLGEQHQGRGAARRPYPKTRRTALVRREALFTILHKFVISFTQQLCTQWASVKP